MDSNLTQFKGAFVCTESELTELEKIRSEVTSQFPGLTDKQYDSMAIKKIKAERKINEQRDLLLRKKEREEKLAQKQAQQAQRLAQQAQKQAQKEAQQAQKAALVNSRLRYYAELDVECDESGKPLRYPGNMINAYNSLSFIGQEESEDVETRPILEKLYYDEFSGGIYYGSEPITDFHRSYISNTLGNVFQSCITRQVIRDVINQVAQQNTINVVKDYLESLKWDKQERIETMFTEYVGAADCKLYREFAKKFMVAAVMRIYEPGKKFDNMIIFTGPQGIGKSNLWEKLAVNPEWYCTNVTIGDKEGMDKLRHSWIVNMDEITALNKKDSAAAKNFLTNNADGFRKAYGEDQTNYKRHCVFVGTTNEDFFLKDETDITERRFWVVKCEGTETDGKIRYNKLTRHEVDQMWAEALHYYRTEDIQMCISAEAAEEFRADQKKYKVFQESELYVFLDDALDRTYTDFTDNESLSIQYRTPGCYTGERRVQNDFTIQAIYNLLRSQNIKFKAGFLSKFADFYPDKWEFKRVKLNGKTTWCLRRKSSSEPQQSASNDLSKLFEMPKI